jgi:hypothetical protein
MTAEEISEARAAMMHGGATRQQIATAYGVTVAYVREHVR